MDASRKQRKLTDVEARHLFATDRQELVTRLIPDIWNIARKLAGYYEGDQQELAEETEAAGLCRLSECLLGNEVNSVRAAMKAAEEAMAKHLWNVGQPVHIPKSTYYAHKSDPPPVKLDKKHGDYEAIRRGTVAEEDGEIVIEVERIAGADESARFKEAARKLRKEATERQRQIVRLLWRRVYEADELDKIAAHLGWDEKTIRRDVDDLLDRFCKWYELSRAKKPKTSSIVPKPHIFSVPKLQFLDQVA